MGGLMDAYVAGNEGAIPNEPVHINETDAIAMLSAQMKELSKKFGTVEASNNKLLPKMTVEVALGLVTWWLSQAESQNGFQTHDLWKASEGFRNDVTRILTSLNAIKNGLRSAPPKANLDASQIEAGYQEIKKLAILMNTNGIQTSPFVMAWDALKEAARDAADKGTSLLKWALILAGIGIGGMLLINLTKKSTVVIEKAE